jgi:hypothetical protein
MTELKPCPFCGEAPEINAHFNPVMGHSLIHRCKVLGPITIDWSERARIVEKWNTRVDVAQNWKDGGDGETGEKK